jgi:hypothetical protein
MRGNALLDKTTLLAIAKDFGVPLLSAVMGALLAYIPSARLAKKASIETLQRDREQRAEAELADARRALVKLTLLTNSLGSFDQQIDGMVKKAELDGNGHLKLWQRLSTFAGIEKEPAIIFDASELTPFISAKRPDVVDALLLLQRRQVAILQGLATFARLRTELHHLFAEHGTTTRDENLVSRTRVFAQPEITNLLAVRADELEIFAISMREQVSEYARYSVTVASLFDSASAQHFGQGALPTLEPIRERAPNSDNGEV